MSEKSIFIASGGGTAPVEQAGEAMRVITGQDLRSLVQSYVEDAAEACPVADCDLRAFCRPDLGVSDVQPEGQPRNEGDVPGYRIGGYCKKGGAGCETRIDELHETILEKAGIALQGVRQTSRERTEIHRRNRPGIEAARVTLEGISRTTNTYEERMKAQTEITRLDTANLEECNNARAKAYDALAKEVLPRSFIARELAESV